MKLCYIKIVVLIIVDITRYSDAALLSNIKIQHPTQMLNTSSSCQCKNRCFVIPSCTFTSWLKIDKNSFKCHSTNESKVVIKEATGWNTYSKKDYCVTPTGEFISNGSVYNTKAGCKQYKCVNSTFVNVTSTTYEYVPPTAFQYYEGLGCVHYVADLLAWTDANNYCTAHYKAVLVNIDTVEGVNHMQRYSKILALTNGFWIAARRTTATGVWKQNFGKDIYRNSTFWTFAPSAEDDMNTLCIKARIYDNFLLTERKCASLEPFVCQMAPKQEQASSYQFDRS